MPSRKLGCSATERKPAAIRLGGNNERASERVTDGRTRATDEAKLWENVRRSGRDRDGRAGSARTDGRQFVRRGKEGRKEGEQELVCSGEAEATSASEGGHKIMA